MINERTFNYDTLPDNRFPRDYRETIYEPYAFPLCPCHYYIQQSRSLPAQRSFQRNNQSNSTLNAEATEAHRLIQQFLTEDGQVDVQKMLQTIGQFADTVQQVSPVIKQINDLVKSFRT